MQFNLNVDYNEISILFFSFILLINKDSEHSPLK